MLTLAEYRTIVGPKLARASDTYSSWYYGRSHAKDVARTMFFCNYLSHLKPAQRLRLLDANDFENA